jgi:hypothetical protein
LAWHNDTVVQSANASRHCTCTRRGHRAVARPHRRPRCSAPGRDSTTEQRRLHRARWGPFHPEPCLKHILRVLHLRGSRVKVKKPSIRFKGPHLKSHVAGDLSRGSHQRWPAAVGRRKRHGAAELRWLGRASMSPAAVGGDGGGEAWSKRGGQRGRDGAH